MVVINVYMKRKHFDMNTNPFIVDEFTSFILLISVTLIFHFI